MRFVQYLAQHQLLASLIVVVVVAAPGYWRVDAIANDSRATADEVAELVEQIQARDTIITLNACRTRNTAQRSTRHTFDGLFDRLARLGTDPAVLAELRDSVPRADDVDRDCTENGTLDEGDYAE